MCKGIARLSLSCRRELLDLSRAHPVPCRHAELACKHPHGGHPPLHLDRDRHPGPGDRELRIGAGDSRRSGPQITRPAGAPRFRTTGARWGSLPWSPPFRSARRSRRSPDRQRRPTRPPPQLLLIHGGSFLYEDPLFAGKDRSAGDCRRLRPPLSGAIRSAICLEPFSRPREERRASRAGRRRRGLRLRILRRRHAVSPARGRWPRLRRGGQGRALRPGRAGNGRSAPTAPATTNRSAPAPRRGSTLADRSPDDASPAARPGPGRPGRPARDERSLCGQVPRGQPLGGSRRPHHGQGPPWITRQAMRWLALEAEGVAAGVSSGS